MLSVKKNVDGRVVVRACCTFSRLGGRCVCVCVWGGGGGGGAFAEEETC